MPWSRDDLIRLVELEAQQQGVAPRLAVALAEQESGFDHTIRSPKGAYGVMQLTPGTARQLKVNIDDPADNIRGGVTYLKQQLDAFGGDASLAVAAYNAGPGVVQAHKGVPPYKETRGLVSRVMRSLGPSRAEAATPQAPSQVSGTSRLHELEAELARRDGQAAPQAPQPPQAPPQALPSTTTSPAPPTAASTPEQDAAYRASRGTQTPPPVSQTAPTAQTPPGASQGPGSPETAWTPGMRFQALPSITQLQPEERAQRTQEFAALTPALQEEFLRSEEPASDLVVDIEKPSTSRAPADLDAAIARELAPAQKGMPLLLGGAGAGTLGRMAGGWAAGQLGRLGTLLPLVGEGLANLGFRKGAVAAGAEEPGTLGDVTAVAAPAVAAGIAPVVAKVGNVLSGVVKPAYQSTVDIAKKYGIRLTYGDVTQGGAAPKLEAFLEGVPGSGAGRMRVGQQADVTKAGETIRTGLQTEMQQTPWRDLASVQQAAGGAGPRAKEAQVLLTEISEAGDDWGRVIQTSGKVNLFQDRVRVEKLYNRVEELAEPLGNMRLPKATQAIDDAIARASDDVLPSPEVKREVIGALNRIKGEISPTAAQPRAAEAVWDPRTNTWRAQPTIRSTIIPDTTYSRMRRLRSSLGDLQREAAEPATARYLSGVKTALEEDMAAFTQQAGVPQLTKAAKDADTFFRTRIVPYREGTLAKAIEKNLPDEIYNQFVRRGKDRAEYFYKGLDAKGQAAVRYGMVEEAIEKANSGAPDVFSPQRFATSLKKIQDAHGVFFKGTPQWEINGITNVMEHAKRAGQYAENPPTGLRAGLGTMIVGGGIFSPLTAAYAMLSGQGLRTMLMTQTGRNFLLAASDMQPGSSVFQQRLDAFLRTLPAAAAGAGAAARAPEETTGR